MTTLITGGTGKTGLILATLLTDAGHPTLLTSRKGLAPAPFKAVKFDWYDESTFVNPFNADPTIDRVYLIGPDSLHPGPTAKPFIDLAIARGVKRFVYLGGAHQEPGGLDSGEVMQLLADSGVEYVVLKPSWFQENFGTSFLESIREKDEICSSMDGGLAPFVSVRDVAQVAFECLTVEELQTQEALVFGPELLTYDEAMKQLSSVLGREIKHKKLSAKEMTASFVEVGLPDDLAEFLVWLEQGTIAGIL